MDQLNVAYIIIVSSIPALYRSWKASPNEQAANLNRILLNNALTWCERYQVEVQGREPDDYSGFR